MSSRHDCTALTRWLLALVVFYLAAPLAFAVEQADNPSPHASTAHLFELILPADHLLGDWGGARSALEASGVTPRLILVTDFAGNPVGGRSEGFTAPTSVELSVLLDLDRIFGIAGGTIFMSASQRWGKSLSNEYIGNVFSAQQIYGFQTGRLIDLSYQQKLAGDRVELRLGRFAATDDFMVSAYSCGLVSNAFCGNPFGILLDAPGMTAYTGTWGALVKVRPTAHSYVMSAVYNGDPDIRADEHHGMDFSMRGPAFAMAEAGYQISGFAGDDRLPGNYKLGAWYDDSLAADFNSARASRGSSGYYALFDQVLLALGDPGSNRGLGVFGSITVAADPDVQQVPVFATAGISARGVFDARPRDGFSLGVAFGQFSHDLRRAQRAGRLPGPADGRDTETVLELTWRLEFQQGAVFIQPDLQYIVHPGGTDEVANALVLGMQAGIHF